MKLVTKAFKVGAIYSDVLISVSLRTYFMFIKADLSIAATYFKYVGGCNCYNTNGDGLYEFGHPTVMYELSNSEVKDLVAKDVIILN